MGQSRARVASGAAARAGVELSGSAACEIPAWGCRGISHCQKQRQLEQSVPCPKRTGWGGMNGPALPRSLPHAPGFGFTPEHEVLPWKTKQLIFNRVKGQLLTSTRCKAHRQNRIMTSTLMKGHSSESSSLSAFSLILYPYYTVIQNICYVEGCKCCLCMG